MLGCLLALIEPHLSKAVRATGPHGTAAIGWLSLALLISMLRIPGDVMNLALIATTKVALSLAFTELAWRFVEQPVLHLKERYAAGPNTRERFAAASPQ